MAPLSYGMYVKDISRDPVPAVSKNLGHYHSAAAGFGEIYVPCTFHDSRTFHCKIQWRVVNHHDDGVKQFSNGWDWNFATAAAATAELWAAAASVGKKIKLSIYIDQ